MNTYNRELATKLENQKATESDEEELDLNIDSKERRGALYIGSIC